MKPILSTLLLSALLAPSLAQAVEISEIAWMGSSDNANAEWIELYNPGSDAVSLSGWRLEGTSAPKITLSGTIAAGGYYLLERTADTSVPGVAADQIYTGALANGGDTLTLKDATGAVIDQIVGGSNWESVGGDNVTKHTAQRVGSTWSTAAGTPRAQNAGGTSEPADEEEEGNEEAAPQPSVGGTTPSSSSSTASPARTLRLDVGDNRIIPTHTPSPFRGIAYTKGNNIRTKATVTWNFGDGIRDQGREVVHTYEHPGTYAVIVRASDEEADTMRALKVIARNIPVTVRSEGTDIIVESNDAVLADISGWHVRVTDASYTFPKDTALWPNSPIRFSSRVTGFATTSELVLEYPDGTPATQAAVPEL